MIAPTTRSGAALTQNRVIIPAKMIRMFATASLRAEKNAAFASPPFTFVKRNKDLRKTPLNQR
jgi:hypothetical protein